ncbi:MAG: hypothetical protein K6T26_01585 [Alicyclobacillus sp.]|nr:hypothetical protein [Alicyclobacillus sp.]
MMLHCVQLRRGQSRSFTFGHATLRTRRVVLTPGVGLVINRGTNTTFVKCGNRAVHAVRVVTLRRGETLVVRCRHCHCA